jgi:hypothetical protein
MSDQASLSSQLRTALVEAFPKYVTRRLQELRVDSPQEVIERSAADLNESLARLEESPHDLGESPLELVRIATEPITGALLAAGVDPVERDAQAAELHPDDLFDLYPATSRDLGEDAWRVHMKWGLERARLVAGMVPAPSPEPPPGDSAAQRVPAVALFGVAEPKRTELADRIRNLGYRPLVWRNPAALDDGLGAMPVLVLVDLRHPTAEGAVRRLVAEGIRVIAIGEGVTDFTQAALMALGAEEAVELDRVVDLLGGRLPQVG